MICQCGTESKTNYALGKAFEYCIKCKVEVMETIPTLPTYALYSDDPIIQASVSDWEKLAATMYPPVKD